MICSSASSIGIFKVGFLDASVALSSAENICKLINSCSTLASNKRMRRTKGEGIEPYSFILNNPSTQELAVSILRCMNFGQINRNGPVLCSGFYVDLNTEA